MRTSSSFIAMMLFVVGCAGTDRRTESAVLLNAHIRSWRRPVGDSFLGCWYPSTRTCYVLPLDAR